MTDVATAASPDLDTAIARLSGLGATAAVRTTSPDLAAQLRQARQIPLRRIVCIGLDTDPQCDLLAETRQGRAAEIDRGLALLREWFHIAPLRIDAHSPATAYPNLLPAMLARRLVRKRLPAGALPTQAGLLIIDVLTAADLPALVSGPPAAVITLPVVIDDHVLQTRYRTRAAATTAVADVLAEAGMPTINVTLRHGPLAAEMSVAPQTPLARTDLWLHVLPLAPQVAAACTRCGECVQVCPVKIHPAALLEAAQRADAKMATRFHAEACVECGLCTAVCPSSLPVMAGVIAAHRMLRPAEAQPIAAAAETALGAPPSGAGA